MPLIKKILGLSIVGRQDSLIIILKGRGAGWGQKNCSQVVSYIAKHKMQNPMRKTRNVYITARTCKSHSVRCQRVGVASHST